MIPQPSSIRDAFKQLHGNPFDRSAPLARPAAFAAPPVPQPFIAYGVGAGTPKILLYPSDVGVNAHQASYILFNIFSIKGTKINYTPAAGASSYMEPLGASAEARAAAAKVLSIGGQAIGDVNSLLLAAGEIKQSLTTIGLYMPASVAVSYSMKYEGETIGGITAAAYNMIKAFMSGATLYNAIEASARDLGIAVAAGGLKAIDAVLPGGTALYAIERGVVTVPKMELMFQGINRRDFEFSFTFIPKSQPESEIVDEIIRTFKINMTPNFVGANVRQQTIPNIFEIIYMHTNPSTQVNSKNQYLNKIGKCFLTDLDVQYGGEKFVTYNDTTGKGPPPQRTVVKMSFSEIEIIDRDMMEREGY